MAGKAYYSLIQYCQDRARLECVNVGVIILAPDRGLLEARVSPHNDRIAQLFGRGSFDPKRLRLAKNGLADRLRRERGDIRSLEDFSRFASTLGNELILTPARPMRLEDPREDLRRLYDTLVEVPKAASSAEPHVPELDRVFKPLLNSPRIQANLDVTVPLIKKKIKVPYAFQNGVLNLVKPHPFPAKRGHAKNTALTLAAEGNLLYQRHDGGGQQLIVVPVFNSLEEMYEIENEIEDVFALHNTRMVLRRDIPGLQEEVRQAVDGQEE